MTAWHTASAVSVIQLEVNAAEIRRAGALPHEEALVKNTGQRSISLHTLTTVGEKLAQQFTTGATSGGYHLNSIGIDFEFTCRRASRQPDDRHAERG